MSVNKLSHLLIFSAGIGVLVYLASSLWGAFFIVSVPQAPDAVVETHSFVSEGGSREIDRVVVETIPIQFKSTLEELKYYHNDEMLVRNRYWLYGCMAFGALCGFIAFYTVPKWRRRLDEARAGGEDQICGAVVGIVAATIVPVLLSWALPAPANWLPAGIVEVAEAKERDVLSRLQAEAELIDSVD